MRRGTPTAVEGRAGPVRCGNLRTLRRSRENESLVDPLTVHPLKAALVLIHTNVSKNPWIRGGEVRGRNGPPIRIRSQHHARVVVFNNVHTV